MKDILLPVAHIFALVIMVFSVTMLAPLVLSIWGLDPALWAFVLSALITFLIGALLWLGTRRFKRELKTRDGLMLVALTWVALPAVAGAEDFRIERKRRFAPRLARPRVRGAAVVSL